MPTNWAEIFLAEVLGTGILILLGDGVVAGVSAQQVEGPEQRLDRHHDGMGIRRVLRRARCRPDQRCPPQPGRDPWRSSLDTAAIGRGTMAIVYWAAEMIGAFMGAVLVFLHYYPHWAETENAGPQARRLLHRAGDPQPDVEPR